jgi:hypothetical protein
MGPELKNVKSKVALASRLWHTGEGIAPLFLKLWHWKGVSSQQHDLAAFTPGEDRRYLL